MLFNVAGLTVEDRSLIRTLCFHHVIRMWTAMYLSYTLICMYVYVQHTKFWKGGVSDSLIPASWSL